jgi:hypothetical protein
MFRLRGGLQIQRASGDGFYILFPNGRRINFMLSGFGFVEGDAVVDVTEVGVASQVMQMREGDEFTFGGEPEAVVAVDWVHGGRAQFRVIAPHSVVVRRNEVG